MVLLKKYRALTAKGMHSAVASKKKWYPVVRLPSRLDAFGVIVAPLNENDNSNSSSNSNNKEETASVRREIAIDRALPGDLAAPVTTDVADLEYLYDHTNLIRRSPHRPRTSTKLPGGCSHHLLCPRCPLIVASSAGKNALRRELLVAYLRKDVKLTGPIPRDIKPQESALHQNEHKPSTLRFDVGNDIFGNLHLGYRTPQRGMDDFVPVVPVPKCPLQGLHVTAVRSRIADVIEGLAGSTPDRVVARQFLADPRSAGTFLKQLEAVSFHSLQGSGSMVVYLHFTGNNLTPSNYALNAADGTVSSVGTGPARAPTDSMLPLSPQEENWVDLVKSAVFSSAMEGSVTILARLVNTNKNTAGSRVQTRVLYGADVLEDCYDILGIKVKTLVRARRLPSGLQPSSAAPTDDGDNSTAPNSIAGNVSSRLANESMYMATGWRAATTAAAVVTLLKSALQMIPRIGHRYSRGFYHRTIVYTGRTQFDLIPASLVRQMRHETNLFFPTFTPDAKSDVEFAKRVCQANGVEDRELDMNVIFGKHPNKSSYTDPVVVLDAKEMFSGNKLPPQHVINARHVIVLVRNLVYDTEATRLIRGLTAASKTHMILAIRTVAHDVYVTAVVHLVQKSYFDTPPPPQE
eukprot:PhM_4_TR5985/c0_g1_i1/m.99478